MKTLIPFLSTFVLIIGAASLDARHWNSDILIPALAVAALFAIAFADGPRPARRALSADLARCRCPVVSFKAPRTPPLKLAA
jgi:hypothetical protein